ncbi:SDR family oxidoreductase [Bdellovibrio sp. HCB337]|uniref:SDR family oxidoreductase n=1 Tax=Bdellovibrio sp. HCB337 TaxID=3394358 RepID=UPI0039A606A4
MKQDLILVTGASGTVGTELIRLLKAEGHKIRATTSKTPKDASSVHVNLATGEGIREAFEGVDKVFLLSPPGYADQYKMLSPMIQEAKRRGVKKVVLMTAMGANASDETPFRRAEIELEKSGLTYNIVRPNWFMENFNTFWIQGIREHGKILLPAGKAKTSFIDAKDISAVIAKLLTTDKFDNKDFDLTGPQALDHDEVAKAISDVTGKKIVYQEIQPNELKVGLLAAGLPADYTEFLLAILGFLREGYSARTTTSVKDILGRAPGDIKQYAQAHKQAWL